MEEKHPGLEAAIKKAGSAAELARRLGVSPQVVYAWRKSARGPSPHKAIRIAALMGISKARLRPDLWGRT